MRKTNTHLYKASKSLILWLRFPLYYSSYYDYQCCYYYYSRYVRVAILKKQKHIATFSCMFQDEHRLVHHHHVTRTRAMRISPSVHPFIHLTDKNIETHPLIDGFTNLDITLHKARAIMVCSVEFGGKEHFQQSQ